MKALSPDKGKHTPLKATAALPQAVIPNEAAPRSFDEQMDSYEAVGSGTSGGTQVAVMINGKSYMPSVPIASGESFLSDTSSQNFGSNTVASLVGDTSKDDDGALPQAVIPLPYYVST